jgi:phenylacetate-coenzyme A ligase PaaK-like adenylate-forming protein
LVVTRDGTLDSLHIHVERGPGVGARTGDELVAEIVHRMRSSLGLGVSASVESAGSLPRSEGGKLSRTIDRRTV